MRNAKASPFGRGVTEGDGEGKPGTKEHLHSDKHWLLIESSYRCVFVLSQHPCPLSRACARQLPQRGSHWRVGQASTGRAKYDVSETVVLRCLGQRQLDKVRLSRSRCPRKQGPPSCVLSSLRRPVESEPACQRLPLWGSCHACGVTERAP